MANFFLYRTAIVWQPNEGVNGASARYVPQFSGDSGVTYRNVNAVLGNLESLLESQQIISNIISNENTFREKVISGEMGTLTSYVAQGS